MLKLTSHAKCPENINIAVTITFQADQHQTTGGPLNFLRTRFRVTLVYTYIEKGKLN